MNTTMTSPTTFEDVDFCPVHGGELKGEYDFGMMDSRVYTYECGCAACCKADGFSDLYYFASYREAAGLARLIVARESIPLCRS